MGLHCTLAGGMKTWPPVESWHTIRLNIWPAVALASVDEVTSPVSVSFSVLPWLASNTGVAEKGTMDKPEDPPEPAGPCGPWGPCGPCTPCGPCVPVTPGAPGDPGCPVAPAAPAAAITVQLVGL